jgi:hypothetical protein
MALDERKTHTKHLKASKWDIQEKFQFKGSDLYVTVRIPVEAIMRRVRIEADGKKQSVIFNGRHIGNIGDF